MKTNYPSLIFPCWWQQLGSSSFYRFSSFSMVLCLFFFYRVSLWAYLSCFPYFRGRSYRIGRGGFYLFPTRSGSDGCTGIPLYRVLTTSSIHLFINNHIRRSLGVLNPFTQVVTLSRDLFYLLDQRGKFSLKLSHRFHSLCVQQTFWNTKKWLSQSSNMLDSSLECFSNSPKTFCEFSFITLFICV